MGKKHFGDSDNDGGGEKEGGGRRGGKRGGEEEEKEERRSDVGDWKSSLCLDWQTQTWSVLEFGVFGGRGHILCHLSELIVGSVCFLFY